LDRAGDGEARRTHVVDQLVEPVEARLRRVARSVAADDAEQATELGERISPGGFDALQGLARPFGLRVEHVVRGRCLDDHDADVVREYVVELSRDPRLFLSGGPSRL